MQQMEGYALSLQSRNTARIHICRHYMVTCPSGLCLQISTAGTPEIYDSRKCNIWKVAYSLQSRNTGLIIMCRHFIVTCPSGFSLQTSTAGTQDMYNATHGRMPPVYNHVIQAKLIYVDIIL